MISYLALNKAKFLRKTSAKLQIPAHYVTRCCGREWGVSGLKLETTLPKPVRNPGIQEP
jgi:hypothetical protein